MKCCGSRLWPVAIAIIGVGDVALAQDLRPIVYVNWGQICSVSVSLVTNRSCLNSQDEFGSPSWRPDGSALVVEAGGHDSPHSLVLLDRRGRKVGGLVGSLSHLRPAWSPDGKYVFGIDYGLGRAVVRWDADGKNRAVVPVAGADGETTAFQMISFNPSGSRVALL